MCGGSAEARTFHVERAKRMLGVHTRCLPLDSSSPLIDDPCLGSKGKQGCRLNLKSSLVFF